MREHPRSSFTRLLRFQQAIAATLPVAVVVSILIGRD